MKLIHPRPKRQQQCYVRAREYEAYYGSLLEVLTTIPACIIASGSPSIPAPKLPFQRCIIVCRFLNKVEGKQVHIKRVININMLCRENIWVTMEDMVNLITEKSYVVELSSSCLCSEIDFSAPSAAFSWIFFPAVDLYDLPSSSAPPLTRQDLSFEVS